MADTTPTIIGSQGYVSSGTASDIVVGSGASISALNVTDSGTVQNTTVNSGGSIFVSNTAVASDTIVSSGGTISAGNVVGNDGFGTDGTIDGASLQSGAYAYIGDGGTGSSITVSSGGGLTINSGGQNFDGVLSGHNALETVFAGGQDSGTQINAGATQVVYGVASGAQVRVGEQHVMAGGSAVGTVLSGASFLSAGMQVVDSGGWVDSTTIQNNGLQTVSSGGSSYHATIDNGGTQSVQQGSVVSSVTISSGGTQTVATGAVVNDVDIKSGGTLSLIGDDSGDGSGAVDGVTIESGGVLQADASIASITGVVMQKGGEIDLFAISSGSNPTVVLNGNVLTVSGGGYSQSITFDSSQTGLDLSDFVLADDDGMGGTMLTYVACFCPGTLIAVAEGEIAVEQLRIGDFVRTVSGALKPIRWIGRRGYSEDFAANNPNVIPVTIRAGAFAEGVPSRDLSVSPLHAMYIDGALVPASALLNGRTIIQSSTPQAVEYIHLEFDQHELIFANGVETESYVEDGSRGIFQNASEYRELYPTAQRKLPAYCAPRLEGGPQLEAMCKRLMDRADDVYSAPLSGVVESVTKNSVCGWAVTEGSAHPVELEVVLGASVIATGRADQFRFDLKDAGWGEGRHGFALPLSGDLSAAQLKALVVRRGHDAAVLSVHESWSWNQNDTPQTADDDVSKLADVAEDEPSTKTENLRGWLDHADRNGIIGWAWDALKPWEKVRVDVFVDGEFLVTAGASDHRPDLLEAGVGTGWNGLNVKFPVALDWNKRHSITVCHAGTDVVLAGSPVILEPGNSFDLDLERAIDRAVSALDCTMERDRALSFMLGQIEKIRQSEANENSERVETKELARRRRATGKLLTDDAPVPRALVIDEVLPVIGRDAGSNAILSHIRALARLGYRVTLATANAVHNPADVAALQREGITVASAPFYDAAEDVFRRQAGAFQLVYLHRCGVASAYAGLARRYMPEAQLVYAVADLHYLRLERQACVEGREDLLALSRRSRTFEITAALMCDVVVTHSPAEAERLRAMAGTLKVCVVPWEIEESPVSVPASRRSDVVFLGNYHHAPNEDAALHLVRDIMPHVWDTLPNIRCVLAGHAPTPAVLRLEREQDDRCGGVHVLGTVRDLRTDLFETAKVTVAPLRFGAGIKGKVLDSFSAGVPCVMSSVAAEGLPLPPRLSALVHDDVEAIASQIVRLHQSPEMLDELGRSGIRMIREYFSARAVDEALSLALGRGEISVRASA